MSSRVFSARSTSGVCYFCQQAGAEDPRIVRGQAVFYLTARATEGAPRPLNAREAREAAAYGRERGAWRRQPRGTRGRAPSAPNWLWEQIVHAGDCTRAAGFRVPGAETTAQRGTRWQGYAHAQPVRAAAPAPAPVVTPAVPTPQPGLCGRQLPYTYRPEQTCVRRRGHRGACIGRSAPAPQPERTAEDSLRSLLESSPGAVARAAVASLEESESRARVPMLDDDAPASSEPAPEDDPSIARFRLLDLD